MSAVAVPVRAPEAALSTEMDRVAVATQWQLMWWRFRKHRLALVSAVVLVMFYLVVLFADFPLITFIDVDSQDFGQECRCILSVAKRVATQSPIAEGDV